MGTFYDPEFERIPFESMTWSQNWGQTGWKFRLRHTAPTSGSDGRARPLPYPTPACVTVVPALRPGRALVVRDSPWFHPFAPPTPQRVASPCSPASSLLWMNPIASSFSSWGTGFSFPTKPRLSPGSEQALPGPDTRCTCVPEFFDTAEPGWPSPWRSSRCCLRPGLQSRHFRSRSFRCSLARPTRTATDASPTPSRVPTHGSRRNVDGWSFVSADFHRLSCAS